MLSQTILQTSPAASAAFASYVAIVWSYRNSGNGTLSVVARSNVNASKSIAVYISVIRFFDLEIDSDCYGPLQLRLSSGCTCTRQTLCPLKSQESRVLRLRMARSQGDSISMQSITVQLKWGCAILDCPSIEQSERKSCYSLLDLLFRLGFFLLLILLASRQVGLVW